jgi:folate-binding protein YgfZ
MTTPPSLAHPFVLDRGDLAEAEAESVLGGAGWGRADCLVSEVAGPGAVACLQGLLTNDLERPGDDSVVYGALLTPKGMIVSDLWALRRGGVVVLVVPAEGRAAVEEILMRTLPPRLARATEQPARRVYRLVGPQALEVAARAGIAAPEPGRIATSLAAGIGVAVARPQAAGPHALELHVGAEHTPALAEALERAGIREVSAAGLELARILAGWPRLGAEIDQKTLPQEVRFDEIDGVSYTKGCYTGQETVARIHFRGHANRGIVGLLWNGRPDFTFPGVAQDEREIGWVTSAAWLPSLKQFVGLAKVRRETDPARSVTAGGAPARVAALPFDLVG